MVKSIRRPGSGLTERLLATFAATDVVFKILTWFPFVVALGIPAGAERVAAGVWLAALAIPGFASFRWLTVRMLRAAESWYAEPTERSRRGAGAELAAEALANAPLRLAIGWAGYWLWPNALFAALVYRGWAFGIGPTDPRFAAPAAFLLAALVTGSLAVGFTLGGWSLAEVTADVSLAADGARGSTSTRFVSLRSRLGGIAFCIVMAPSFWFTALALVTDLRGAPGPVERSFAAHIGAFLVVAAAFGPLVAWLLASTLADPLRRITEAISRIADEGEWSEVGRVPASRRDEIGDLGAHLNRMIERLERLWHERTTLEVSLAAMNRELEGIVRERTESLEATNRKLVQEIADRERIEVELRLAQKLEAVGQLAAGVAHEINTPVQFVGDSVEFVRDSMRDLAQLVGRYRELRALVASGRPAHDLALQIADDEQRADLDYVLANVPPALERSLEGLERVATIVRSMKEFAHPDSTEMIPVDLNQAIRSTLVIARNEYKYVADVETELGELPPVLCHAGDVNQALLNVIVNAAHAIEDVVSGTERRGRITIRTRREGDSAVVTIADTGGGIPAGIRDRVFDPFFTTKEVGRGTGQGLAITRTVVCDRHGGDISFETEPGAGTTFRIRLPLHGDSAATALEAA